MTGRHSKASVLVLVGGGLVAATIATATPASALLAAMASQFELLRGGASAIDMLLGIWGLLAGAWIVGVRFAKRRYIDGLCVPILGLIVFVCCMAWTAKQSAEAGSMMPEAALTFGAVSSALAVLSLIFGTIVWRIVSRLADQLVAIAEANDPASDALCAQRIGMWLVSVALTQTLLKLLGGPLGFAIAASVGAAAYFAYASRRGAPRTWRYGIGAALLAFFSINVQNCSTESARIAEKREHVAPCADADDGSRAGVYSEIARKVPGIRDAVGLWRTDRNASVVSYRVELYAASANGAAISTALRDQLTAALQKSDCAEEPDLEKAPFVILDPRPRSVNIAAAVRVSAGANFDDIRTAVMSRVRDALPQSALGVTGAKINLPTAREIPGVTNVDYQIDGSRFTSGSALGSKEDGELPLIGNLTVVEEK